MQRHVSPRALKRAQWLGDLTFALAEAEKLLTMLESGAVFPDETVRLRQRVQAVRSELDLLNRVILGEGRVVGPAWPGSESARLAER
jgi:hypothetical protein